MDPVTTVNPAWIMDNTGMPFSNVFMAIVTFLTVFGFAGVVYYIIKSGHGYSNKDADEDAEDYAGTITEARGGLTALLIISYVLILAWTVYYFYINWYQFEKIFVAPG